jgi:hypothetical protein
MGFDARCASQNMPVGKTHFRHRNRFDTPGFLMHIPAGAVSADDRDPSCRDS